MKKPIIICVDDEIFFLVSLRNTLRSIFGNKIHIEIAESGYEALNIIKTCVKSACDIPIVIADYLMPKMMGDRFLILAHKLIPNSKKILLTGNAKIEGIKNAVNEANLYRFVLKPWDKLDLELTLVEAFKIFYKEKLLNSHFTKSKSRLNSNDNINNNVNKNPNNISREEFNLIKRNYETLFNNFMLTLLRIDYKSNLIILERIKRLIFLANKIIVHNMLENAFQINLCIFISQLYLLTIEQKLSKKIIQFEPLTESEQIVVNSFKDSLKQIISSKHVYPNLLDIALTDFDKIELKNSHNNDINEYILKQVIRIIFEFERKLTQSYTTKEAVESLKEIANINLNYVNSLLKKHQMTKTKDIEIAEFYEISMEGFDKLNLKNITKPVRVSQLKVGDVLADDVYDIDNNLLLNAGQEITLEIKNSMLVFLEYHQIKEPLSIID